MLTEREKKNLAIIKEKFGGGGSAKFSPEEYQLYRSLLIKLENCGVIYKSVTTMDGTHHCYSNGGIEAFEKAQLEEEKEQRLITGISQRPRKTYDVFISHANKDKSDYVDALYLAIRKLGVNIFYDTEVLSWGDNWKQAILDGTESSEFAIIVISDNFFDREWTERELSEFLKRQNASGQKIVLPLLHNISLDMLKAQYPTLGDIQVITTERYSKEEVAILFAKELIKRLKY